MDIKEIKQIVELMNKNELSYFHLERDDFRLKLKKGADFDALQTALASMPSASAAPAAAPAAAPVAASASAAGAPAAEAAPEFDGDPFESPMVGTFYRSASPDSDAFVKVGQEVDADTTLCVIEAMKVFNEIKAERSGVITKILLENAQPVQYGEPLFIIKSA
ncbi:MAG: acetyl-CoA carboxylase biotin carboxyl carrier protein [Verrucomicrobiales bacterium]